MKRNRINELREQSVLMSLRHKKGYAPCLTDLSEELGFKLMLVRAAVIRLEGKGLVRTEKHFEESGHPVRVYLSKEESNA